MENGKNLLYQLLYLMNVQNMSIVSVLGKGQLKSRGLMPGGGGGGVRLTNTSSCNTGVALSTITVIGADGVNTLSCTPMGQAGTLIDICGGETVHLKQLVNVNDLYVPINHPIVVTIVCPNRCIIISLLLMIALQLHIHVAPAF